MSTILITGASGTIGTQLTKSLLASGKHKVVCLSRRKPDVEGDFAFVPGAFHEPENLRGLDEHPIDAVVHLAAVTGGCSEHDGIVVNVEGTRCLMRYLIDHSCKKFVLASSIAAAGFQNVKFRPLELPIPDEHPCLDRDGYGVSKYLMEEIARYLQLQNEDIDVIAFRLAAIIPDEPKPEPYKTGAFGEWTFARLALMFLSDAVKVFTLGAEAPLTPGMRVMNAVAPAFTEDGVPAVIRTWFPGTDLDLSWYERPGHENDPVYDIRRVRAELGFEPKRLG